MKRATLLLVLIATGPFSALAQSQPQSIVYFAMIDRSRAISQQEFIFGVTDPAVIQRIRTEGLGNGGQGADVIGGIIKRGRKSYNPSWNFHFVPETVNASIEGPLECDATAMAVEDHIEDIGTPPLLPGFAWCPWNMKVIREVKPILD